MTEENNDSIFARRPEKKPCVMIIDDDPVMLRVAKKFLDVEYQVAVAIGGKHAYRFLENRTADLILLDYVMPDETGPEVYERIRSMANGNLVPICFMTGAEDKERKLVMQELHPAGYIHKPIKKEELLELVHRLVPVS